MNPLYLMDLVATLAGGVAYECKHPDPIEIQNKHQYEEINLSLFTSRDGIHWEFEK